MTEKELRKEIGISPTGLLNSTKGLVDIFGVKDDKVRYGFLAGGDIVTETTNEFLARFTNATA